MPGVPSPFQGIDVGKTFVDEFLCRTGTSSLVGSSAVEDQGFVLGIGTGQGLDRLRLDANRPLDF